MENNLIDRQILSRLYSSRNRHVLMDEILSGCKASEATVHERLAMICQLGYVLETHPQYGVKLQSSPDDLMADDLAARLDACNESKSLKAIGNKIIIFEKTSSTNDVIHRFAKEGHSEGLVVFAESQTGGRGRHGRSWHSPPKRGLWFSILLRPDIDTLSAPRLTTLTTVAIARALMNITGLKLQVKWPNDILCQGKKVCGILVELSTQGEKIQYANVGIGINVNLKRKEFPAELLDIATSLEAEAGSSFSRPALAAEVLHQLNQFYVLIQNDDFSYVHAQWLELDCTLGQPITIKWTDGRKLRGIASNLDPDGALLVRTDDGMMERITAGEVSLEKQSAGNQMK